MIGDCIFSFKRTTQSHYFQSVEIRVAPFLQGFRLQAILPLGEGYAVHANYLSYDRFLLSIGKCLCGKSSKYVQLRAE